MQKLTAWAITALMMLSNLSYATADQPQMNALDQIMQDSGFAVQMQHLQKQTLDQIKEGFQTGNEAALVEQRVKAIFDDKAIIQNARTALNNELTEDEVIELRNWFASDAGKELVQKELDASDKTFDTNINPVTDEVKMQAITQIMELSQTKTYAMNLQQYVMKAVYLSNYEKLSLVFDQAAYQTMIDKNLAEANQQLDRILLHTFAYIYKDVSNENLQAYVNMLSSRHGKKFIEQSAQAVYQTIEANINTLSEQLEPSAEPASVEPKGSN